MLLLRTANFTIHQTLKRLRASIHTRILYDNVLWMNIKNVTATFLCNFIVLRLGNIGELHKLFQRYSRFKLTGHILGYKFVITGRLREEKGLLTWFIQGYRTSKYNYRKITYAADFRVMRFGSRYKSLAAHSENRPFFNYYLKFYNEHTTQ
jgi:hypothetical protein